MVAKVKQLVVYVLLAVLHQVLIISSMMMPIICVETFSIIGHNWGENVIHFLHVLEHVDHF